MRVTFNSTYMQSAADLAKTTREMVEAQLQVSSGRRMSAASDDPAAAAGSVRERSEIAALDHYAKAADSVQSRLTVVDTVLADILEQVTSARTTILGARGSSVTQSQREAAVNELMGIRDALLSDFNSTFRGTYLFSGSAATTAPYARQADGSVTPNAIDDTPVLLEIDKNTVVQMSYSSVAIARGSDPTADDLFVHLQNAIAAVAAGDDAAMQTATDGLNGVFARAVAAQSHAGSSLKAIEAQQGRVAELKRASEARVAEYEGADLAEAISRMNQAETAYQAALGAIAATGRLTLMDYLR